MPEHPPFIPPSEPTIGDSASFKQLFDAINTKPENAPNWLDGSYENDDLPVYKQGGNEFIPGSHFRKHVDVDLDWDPKPEILLGESGKLDPRIETLKKFAETLQEATDKKTFPSAKEAQAYIKDKHGKLVAAAREAGDITSLYWLNSTDCFDVSLQEAETIQSGNQIKKEAFYGKTFHTAIHEMLGDYNSEVSGRLQSENDAALKTLKNLHYKKDGTVDFSGVMTEQLRQWKLDAKATESIKRDKDGAEHMQNIGKQDGEYRPVCRHYAPVMSLMLDEVKIRNITFGFKHHATVASLDTSHIFETTAKHAEDCYRYSLNSQKPNLLADRKEFYYTTITGHISSIDLNSVSDSLDTNILKQKILIPRFFDQQAAKMGQDKFGAAVAKAYEEGKPLNSIAVIKEMKNLPASQRPMLSSEEQRLLDMLDTNNKNEKKKEEKGQRKEQNQSAPKDIHRPMTSAIEIDKSKYGQLQPALPQSPKPSSTIALS